MAFPASVVEMLRGDLGQPPGGWPAAMQAKALKGSKRRRPIAPAALLPPADIDGAARRGRKRKLGHKLARASWPRT